MKNNIVLITGASGNLGSAVVSLFEKNGSHLVLVDHAKERLLKQFAFLENNDRHLIFEGVDGTDSESMKTVISRIKEKFGRLDVLVNTVGGFRAGPPLHETDLDTYELMFNLNVKSVFITSKFAIPLMLENKNGAIVHISSGAGLKGAANMAVYSAAKSAVIRFTESMAAELKSSGVRVNCILPGTIDTPQNREAMPKADFSRWVSPASLAEAIYFLTSSAARDVTGVALPVYGSS
ncbi:MAG: 3-oxoacyl-ACP reductase [Anaerolineaceae bacterium]|nr:3-oxoacyl-ACP reductase [Anaerolineaceae bacterium]